jgi:hypothetical protein
LHFVRHVTGIDRRARRADAGAEGVGEFEDDREVLLAAESPPAGNDLRRRLQVGTI